MTELPPDTSAPVGTPGRIFVPDFVRPERRRLVLIAGILASSMGFIDGTVVSIATPAIRSTLGASLGQVTWINNGYLVTLSALILAGGAFGDRFGLGKVFGLGIGLFIVTSLVCALAPSPQLLILARLAQGVGAALMVPGSLAVISRAYPREMRGRAIGLWAGASAITTAGGPIIGGLALTLGGDAMWRWIFAINLPLGIAALWLLKRGIDKDAARPGEPIDLIGAGLATLGLGLLAWALAHGEDGGGVIAPLPIALAFVGIGVLALFVLHQRVSRKPMMPLSLFASRTFSAANFATFMLYFGLTTITFFLPMLTIAGWGISEFITILALGPLSLCMVLFSTRFGRLAEWIGPGPVIAMGAFLAAAAHFWLARSVMGMNFWLGVLPPMTLMGFAMSMVVAPLSTAVMGAVRDDQTGIASGVNNAISRTGGLIAVALMGSVAGAVYAGLGGPASYGLPVDVPGHAEAMTGAFSRLVLVCSALSLIAAVVAAAGIRMSPAEKRAAAERKAAAQAGSVSARR